MKPIRRIDGNNQPVELANQSMIKLARKDIVAISVELGQSQEMAQETADLYEEELLNPEDVKLIIETAKEKGLNINQSDRKKEVSHRPIQRLDNFNNTFLG